MGHKGMDTRKEIEKLNLNSFMIYVSQKLQLMDTIYVEKESWKIVEERIMKYLKLNLICLFHF